MPTPGKLLWITALLIIFQLRSPANPLPFYPLPHPTGPTHPAIAVKSLYKKATAFFSNPHPTAATDSMALLLFEQIISRAGTANFPDDLLFQSWLKKGVLLDVKGRYQEALNAYTGALGCLRRHPEWSDSLYFKIYIYSGPDYYQLDDFDSAWSLLNKAEELADRFHGLPEKDRLYNALGALYYESGNYLQARNYFSRALGIIRSERPNDKASDINFSNNIASCLYKLGAYRQSIDLYRLLIGNGIFSSQLYLNMGKSYIELKDYDSAMIYFRQVQSLEVPGVFNEMAYTQFLLGKNDSALFFLDKWSKQTSLSSRNKLDAGVNDLYRGQVLMSKDHPIEAMNAFQRAIITFSGTFTSADILANPLNFTGSFASYRLFDAIISKAAAWEQLYAQSRRDNYLLGAWQAYNSAILLFRHIEKTCATDDARLFLKKKNRELYRHAFETGLALDRLHPDGGYLEAAFEVEEKSKASILSANLDVSASGHIPGVDPQLLQRLRTIKYKIARLELKTDPEQGTVSSQAAADQKADDEIELSRLQKNLEMNSAHYKFKFEDASLTVKELQEHLSSNQAMISLYVSKGLHVFTLTATSFHHLYLDSLPLLTQQVREWISMLSNPVPGHRFGNKVLEGALYNQLVKPLLQDLPGKDEWIIIPDEIFNLLPFESLPADEDSNPLLETKIISYQPSAKFLINGLTKPKAPYRRYAVLSFAPFAGSGEWVNTSPVRFLDRLPSSGAEIDGLQGLRYINALATKDRFLRQLNHFPVVHLATHALSDLQDPQAPMICFFPQHKGTDEDCLFLSELYGLNMDSTDLVILSTCGSGNGELVDNEGVMSLSRGFLYAGCASTVNSLWKADDQSTEAILQKFHIYLEKGYGKPAALRQAKLDYIHSNAIYISPNYWAHLVLVGNTDPVIVEEKNSGLKWGLVAGMAGLFPLLIGLILSARKRRLLNL
jgi:CHAT domain-containing protein